MRFHPNGPSIPDLLLQRCDSGRVVFLCGAGVSVPSGMPTFVELTKHVIEFLAPPTDSDIMTAFRPWLHGQSGGNVALDQIFNLLHLEYGKDEVNALVTDRLRASLKNEDFGREHGLIKRISSSPNGMPQIVTTNFDRLFEAGQDGDDLAIHVPPAFPDLSFGSGIEGITYLHGRLVDAGSESHSYVLSSGEFGRAYLSEGWATNFIRHLLARYTVVLVGYQAEDPPIKYLLQGLNHDGQYDRSKLYAFDRGLPEEIEAKWRDRGVTAIAYANHSDLWTSLESWADRVDNPRGWRSSTIAKCQQDPKNMAPHKRGQVAHVLRTVQGAKLFSEADPAPHPEWLCVLDANVRSAKPSRGYGEDAESFDPWAAYGLDDDVRDISEDDRKQGVGNDSLLVWREGDDSPHDFHRLGGGYGKIPKRLWYFITWIGKSIDSPVVAWWAIRQDGLHPRLLQHLEWQVEQWKTADGRARHLWELILEHHRDPRNRQRGSDWFDLKKRVNTDGWTASVLREFRRVAAPRLEIKPPYGLQQCKPPSVPWENIRLGDLGQFDVGLLENHNEDIEVADDRLLEVFSVLEDQLVIAEGLLRDIEISYFVAWTCYPDREVEVRGDITSAAEVVAWFTKLFDRMAANWPELAHAHAITWPGGDQFFFLKLKLYAFNKPHVFAADQVVKEVLSLDQEIFWKTDLTRELLFLLVDRWKEFSPTVRNQVTDRILAGPDQRSYWSDEEFPNLRDEFAVRYARYLELQECELSVDGSTRLAEMIRGIPEWSDSWATSTVCERGSHGGWVRADEAPDVLIDIPVNKVVSRAREDQKHDFGTLIEKRPFAGLVKANPRKALAALTIEGRNGDFPTEFWSSIIESLPLDIAPRLMRVFLSRVARLPHTVIVELRHSLGRWLEQNLVRILKFDSCLGWAVYDHIIDGFLAAGADAAKSGLGEVSQGGKPIPRSRRTFHHAINGPIGMCVNALFHAVSTEKHQAGSLIPDYIESRLERLIVASGEGSDHAVAIISSRLNWLMFVDPAWTTERLIPMLGFHHPACEPAWNGFLHSQQPPWPPLAMVIKPLLINLFPWVEGLFWDRALPNVAAQWLGFMRIFHKNELAGLSRVEMRSVLRAMSDETRNRFIFWLGQVGEKNENGWAQRVIPLINEDWPRERQYRTSTSMRAWIALLDDTGDSFPAVYEAVKKFLVPMETDDHPFYRFTRDMQDEKPITVRFPEATLDLMNRATPEVITRQPYELPKVLELIAETEPGLMSDSRYLRLIDLIERS